MSDPMVYEKSFVVYSFDEELTIEDINRVLKEFNVTAREITDEEVIYKPLVILVLIITVKVICSCLLL